MCAVRYVTFSVEVTARVDANEDRSGNMVVSEVSSLCIGDLSLDRELKDMREYLEETAAETALADGEWHE